MQYPQVSLHSNVRGMNTFGLNVIRVPCAPSRIAEASAISASVDACSSRCPVVVGADSVVVMQILVLWWSGR